MSEELEELTTQAYRLDYGRARSAALEEVVTRAEAEGEEERAFEHRIDLVVAYVQGGEPRLMFAPFGRLLADLDADPGRFGRFTTRVLWQYKSAVGSMTKFPEVGLAQTYAALDDMERRWRASGHSLHAVHQYRWLVAHHVGDAETAERQFRAWSTAPRDNLSDCAGCDPDDKVVHLQDRGRHEEAAALGLDALSRPLGCVDQPESLQTTLLPSLVATGRLDEARDAHQRAYRAIRTRPAQLRHEAAHLRFATLTGNLDRAREIFVRHVPELGSAPSPYAAMEFQAIAARALRAMVATDPGTVVADEGGRPAPAGALADRYAAAARDLAARFDERNRSTNQSSVVEHLLAEAPWMDHLPLLLPIPVAEPRTPAADQPDVTVAAEEAGPEIPAEPVDPTPEPLADPEAVGVDALLDLVEEALARGEVTLAAAALERFEAERTGTGRTEQERGRVAYSRSAVLDADGRVDEEIEELRRALVHFDAAGDELRRQRSRAVLGVTLMQHGDLAEATVTADDALTWLVEHDEPSRRWGWGFQRVRLDQAAGRREEAYAGLLRLVAEPGGHLAQREYVALLLTQEELGRRRWSEAVETATLAAGSTDPDWWRWARRFRADARRALGDAAGAIDDRLQALAGSAEVPDAASDPTLVLDLGDDYLAADRVSEAAEAGEVAVRLLGPDGRPDLVERARLQLLGAYRRLDQPALALEQVEALEDAVGADTPPLWRAQLLGERGSLLLWLERWPPARTALVEAAAAYALADDPLGQVRSLRQALGAALEMGAREDARASWEQAYPVSERLAEETGERWFQQGWLWLERAALDHAAGDDVSARDAFARAETVFQRGGFGDQAREAALRRAEALGADLDDLRALFVDAEARSNPWYRSGWLLVDALAAAGRPTEASGLIAELESAQSDGS